jgi:multidrug efflux pump subunit AcrA (membrane-fusion protein)
MFARGEFELGSRRALTLPQAAVKLRDGLSYVLQLEGDSKVREVKVATGRRQGDRLEITGGLDAAARVVADGVGFLGDGDTVRVVSAPPAATPGRSTNAQPTR